MIASRTSLMRPSSLSRLWTLEKNPATLPWSTSGSSSQRIFSSSLSIPVVRLDFQSQNHIDYHLRVSLLAISLVSLTGTAAWSVSASCSTRGTKCSIICRLAVACWGNTQYHGWGWGDGPYIVVFEDSGKATRNGLERRENI